MDAFFLKQIYSSLLLLCYSVFNLLVPQFALLHPSENGTRPFFGSLKHRHLVEKAFLMYFGRRLSFAFVDTLG